MSILHFSIASTIKKLTDICSTTDNSQQNNESDPEGSELKIFNDTSTNKIKNKQCTELPSSLNLASRSSRRRRTKAPQKKTNVRHKFIQAKHTAEREREGVGGRETSPAWRLIKKGKLVVWASG